jgi:phosphoribosylformylglycinamidine cyclo-ligase
MVRTFNCGVGMVVVVAASETDGVTELLEQAGETVSRIGRIDKGPRGCTVNGPERSWTAMHNA